jgi:hypothetical protein
MGMEMLTDPARQNNPGYHTEGPAMARVTEPSDEDIREWLKWVEERPEPVKSIAKRFDPWSLYRFRDGGQRATLVSISENGTVTVRVTGEFNIVMFDRDVFGVNPDDLEPCDLPGPDEVLGTWMTPTEVDENIDALRVLARPDLWVMGADGKAHRKQ